MRSSYALGLGGILLATAPAPAFGQPGGSAEAPPLAVVTRTQEGFAGRIGTRTTLAADGRYVVERLIDDAVVARLRSGTLGGGALDAARAAIAAARLPEQPTTAGHPPPVNPLAVSIEAAGVRRTVVGTPPPATAGADVPLGPVAALARSLEQATGGSVP